MNFNDPLAITGIRRAVSSLGGTPYNTGFNPPGDPSIAWPAVVGDILGGFWNNQVQQLKVRALKAIGYKDHDPKIVTIDGKVYALLKNQLGVVKKVGPDGVETDYTPVEQTKSQVLSASGQWMTGTTIGIGLVAAAALFLLMRRK
jgi:hypothetical protein